MTDSFRRIHVRKEQFKFAAAHMTVFPDGSKESLHGHNYTVELTVDLAHSSSSSDEWILFSDLKAPLLKICQSWDEHVLLPLQCKYLKVQSAPAEFKNSLDFILCGKRYILPADEVVGLNVTNVTVETLAEEFCRQYVELLTAEKSILAKIRALVIRIDESPGQGASFFWTPGKQK